MDRNELASKHPRTSVYFEIAHDLVHSQADKVRSALGREWAPAAVRHPQLGNFWLMNQPRDLPFKLDGHNILDTNLPV